MTVEVKRAGSRRYERLDWLHAWHCLTGPEYVRGTDSHFGVLVNNDHGIMSAGTGFDHHYHRNMEIITWVLDGSVVHQDTRGHSGIIHPGLAQRMTSGRGILHSERNDSWVLDGPRHERDVELVQMWVVPDTAGVNPSYEQLDITTDLDAGGLVLLATGIPKYEVDAAIRIRNRFASLWVARLQPGGTVTLPSAPWVHVYVPRGSVDIEGAGVLGAGDALRSTGEQGRRVTAVEASELLVWEMFTSL